MLRPLQVTVVHVYSQSKNAADSKLTSFLRKFGHSFKAPGTVVMISSDVNFAPELHSLRYFCGFDVIIVHGARVVAFFSAS